MSKKIYIVMYSVSSYGNGAESHNAAVCAFEDEADALSLVKEHRDHQEKIDKLAIRNYDSYKDRGKTVKDKKVFSNLQSEFFDYLWKSLFGDRGRSEISDEEYEKFRDCDYNYEFVKFMMDVKKYSKDVANATIAYNCEEFGEYHREYYIKTIDFVESSKK